MNPAASALSLFRAPFVVPVSSPPIADGGVLVQKGKIVAVDGFARLRREAARVVDLENSIITPALINCHAHLELSYLAGLGDGEVDNSGHESSGSPDFTGWIRALLLKRGQPLPPAEVMKAGRKALFDHHQRGIALVADIGNHPSSLEICAGQEAECLFFRELLALSEQGAEAVLASLHIDEQCTAHAPYSCHPILLKALKERARRAGHLFPIHLAESADEVTFSYAGTGPFHDFLRERLRLTSTLADDQPLSEVLPHPGCGGVEYLRALGVLDGQTICVHAVHVSETEIDILAESKAKVCLCPASNRKLGVGTAPVPLFLERNIVPGLGTDSLASNDCLDLWHEMKVLQQDHPSVSPEQIFAMATVGGAAALGAASRLGTLAPNREARLLAIDFSGQQSEIFPYLVNKGTTQQVRWVEGG